MKLIKLYDQYSSKHVYINLDLVICFIESKTYSKCMVIKTMLKGEEYLVSKEDMAKITGGEF